MEMSQRGWMTRTGVGAAVLLRLAHVVLVVHAVAEAVAEQTERTFERICRGLLAGFFEDLTLLAACACESEHKR